MLSWVILVVGKVQSSQVLARWRLKIYINCTLMIVTSLNLQVLFAALHFDESNFLAEFNTIFFHFYQMTDWGFTPVCILGSGFTPLDSVQKVWVLMSRNLEPSNRTLFLFALDISSLCSFNSGATWLLLPAAIAVAEVLVAYWARIVCRVQRLTQPGRSAVLIVNLSQGQTFLSLFSSSDHKFVLGPYLRHILQRVEVSFRIHLLKAAEIA
jgi:hypothetical protein